MARRGRPPLDPTDRSVSVHVKITARCFDALYQSARAQRLTMPELMRRLLRRELRQVARPDDERS